MWFLDNELKLPAWRENSEMWEINRPGSGIWKRPSYATIMSFLRNPAYAGIYAYGKSKVEHSYQAGKLSKAISKQNEQDWRVRIADHHEGYISESEYNRIQQMIEGNNFSAHSRGAARNGEALLTGLLRCQRCGRKLSVSYTGRKREALRYFCCLGYLDQGLSKCLSFGGVNVDKAIGKELLKALEPAAFEAAKQAHLLQQQKGDEILNSFNQELEQTRYEVKRTRRQYDAVDPENRLVASELERRWNSALERVSSLEKKRAEVQEDIPATQMPEHNEFLLLAQHLEKIWDSEQAQPELKKKNFTLPD